MAGNRTPPPEASGSTPDSGSVPGIASVELRGHGFSLADVHRLSGRARLSRKGHESRVYVWPTAKG